jgi:hypothetical protein
MTPVFGLREPLPVVFRTQKPQVFQTSQSSVGVLQISGGVLQNIFQKHQIFPIRFQRVAVYPN